MSNNNIQIVDEQTQKFFAHLHRGGDWAYYWVHPGKTTIWWQAGDPSPVPAGDINVYFSVHPTIKKKGKNKRASVVDIAAINCLYADFDVKDFDGDRGKILTHIIQFLVPSVVIDSGGGYHAYWLLNKPFILNTKKDRDRAKVLQAAWVTHVGGDTGAKDLARILRVPGTHNYKEAYAPKYPLVQYAGQLIDPEFNYELDFLEELAFSQVNEAIPMDHPIVSANAGQYWLKCALLRAVVGNRNDNGFWLACQLRDSGLSQGDAELVIQNYAESVPPSADDPYTEQEALASVKSAYSQPPRGPANGFTCLGMSGDGATPIVLQPGSNNEMPNLPSKAVLPDDLGADACPWLDIYIDFSRKWSPRSFDGFHEATGLWVLSTIAARRVLFHFGKPRYTNLYIMLGGRTTIHAKSSATDIGRQVLATCGLEFLLAPDESTPQSFIRYLSSEDNDLPKNFDLLDDGMKAKIRMRHAFKGQVGWYAEEFGSWIASMMRTDGIMADFRGLLRKLDDCPDDYKRITIGRGLETVEKPYLGLIANLTPADLKPLAKKGTQLWGDGFLARFAFITPPLDELLDGRFPDGERKIPQNILSPLIEWHKHLGIPKVSISEITNEDKKSTDMKIIQAEKIPAQVLQPSKDVVDAFYNYHDAISTITRDSQNTDLDGNYGRLAEKSFRMSALFASLGGKSSIDIHHWARAQEIAERFRLFTHRLYSQVNEGSPSIYNDLLEKIVGILKRHATTDKYPQGMTANDVARFVHKSNREEVEKQLQRLDEMGIVTTWRPQKTVRYLLPNQQNEERK